MAHNDMNTAKKLQLLFRMLPILGAVLLALGMIYSIDKLTFDGVSIGLFGLGILFFLTLFLKAEVANIKYYLNIAVYSVAVFAICIVGYRFSQNYTKQIDLTKQKLYSLSDESAKVIKRLKPDQVEIVVFTPDSRGFQPVMDIYNTAGKKIKWTFLDAKKDPIATRNYGDNLRNGTVLVKSGKKDKRLQLGELEGNYENTLTNAIVEVTREKEIKIYFTKGHGEVAFDAPTPNPRQRQEQDDEKPSLKAFKDFLNQRALQTAEVNIAEGGLVPSDASLVVIAGPTSDLLPSEVAALEKYLGADGHLLVMLDVPKTNFNAPLTNLLGLMKKYGVNAPDKIVLDLLGQQLLQSAARPVVTDADPSHPITKDFSGRMVNLFLGETRPIDPVQGGNPAYQVTTLIKSSEYSWAEDLSKVLASQGRLSPPDQKQPQSLGVAVSMAPPPSQPGMPAPPPPQGGMRMVVYGNSDLIQDRFVTRYPAAAELMLNTINWLTQQEDIIAVPPKQVQGTPIHLTATELRLIFALSVVLIPGILFFGGISYSLLRRRR